MTSKVRTRLLLSALLSFAVLSPAHAQDKAEPAKTEKPAAKEEAKPVKKAEKKVDLRKPKTVEAQSVTTQPTGVTKEWIDAENKLIDPLNEKDKETVLIMRNKYSYIRATRVVSRDVGNAVKSCGDKNPGMKDKMDARYKQWRSAIDPILDTAQKQLDKDIDAQKVVDAGDLRDVLDLHDEAYEAAEKQITKTPVTTKDACEGTLASMDRTEDNLIAILQQTLLPENVIRKRAADAEKMVAKEKAAKQASQKAAPKADDKPDDKPKAD